MKVPNVIMFRYKHSVKDSNLVEIKHLGFDEYDSMVSEDNRRFFKARVVRQYTKHGYCVTRWTSRRWGDNVKFIEIFKFPNDSDTIFPREFCNE